MGSQLVPGSPSKDAYEVGTSQEDFNQPPDKDRISGGLALRKRTLIGPSHGP